MVLWVVLSVESKQSDKKKILYAAIMGIKWLCIRGLHSRWDRLCSGMSELQ